MLWLQKLLNPIVVAVHNGSCTLAKGHLPTHTLREIEGVLRDFHGDAGTIAVDGRGAAHFSSSIPVGAHQRLRNLIASR